MKGGGTMPSEVEAAVASQRASNADQVKRDNVNKIMRLIKAGMPLALAEMRENNFPIYVNKGFEQSWEQMRGKRVSIWKFQNSQAFKDVMRGTTKVSVEVAGQNREFGIYFREGTKDRATDVVIVGRSNQSDEFAPVRKEALLELEPYQIDAIRAVLDLMQKPPSDPVWRLPVIPKP